MVNLFKKNRSRYGFVIFVCNFLVIYTIKDVSASSQISTSQTAGEQSKNPSNTKKKVTFNIDIKEIENNREIRRILN